MITEIKNDYTDDLGYTHIDIWEDDNEEGKSCAVVCNSTGKVCFIDNSLRGDSGVKEAIEEVLKELNLPKVTMEEYLKSINFKLLKMQKIDLVVAMSHVQEEGIKDSLDGILALLDNLQDIAVDQYGMDENEVFQFTE